MDYGGRQRAYVELTDTIIIGGRKYRGEKTKRGDEDKQGKEEEEDDVETPKQEGQAACTEGQ